MRKKLSECYFGRPVGFSCTNIRVSKDFVGLA